MAQNLSQNLGVSPFGSSRPVLPMAPRNDGFSEDGLSYAVIDDIPKITAQALAEYETRLKKPRIDIWGKPLKEDTAVELQHELLDPLAMLSGQYPNRPTLPKTFEIGDTLVSQGRDGGWNTVYAKDNSSKISDVDKINLTELQKQREDLSKGIAGTGVISKDNQAKVDSISQKIAGILARYESQTQSPSAPSLSPAPQPQIFMGNPQQPATTNSQPLKILGIRQRQ